MDKPLAEFIEMLRYADVPVSIGESIDAATTVQLLGYEDRGLLKAALAQVMAKTIDEHQNFERCFDQFFSYNVNPDFDGTNPTNEPDSAFDAENENNDGPDDSVPGEAPQGAAEGAPGQGSGGMGEGQSQEMSLLEMLEQNDRTALTMAMTAAASAVNLSGIGLMTLRGLFPRRIMDQMGLDQINR
jgi:uncharacterized protein with von Willebrand factor type A (vWA) domain